MSTPELIVNNEGNGKYRIEKFEKAKSSNSIVREGENIGTGENVITKEIKLESKAHQLVFKNEVYLLEKLSSCPYIVKAYSSFILHDCGYIVLEKIEADLLSLIETDPLEEKIAKSVFYQVALALQFMHEKRVCHRDIKPENILVEKIDTEPYYNVKLCDFGSACEWEPDSKTINGVQGTIMYVAPEVKKRVPYVPQKADIYSLGILLHVILTALFPYDASYGKNPSLDEDPEIIISKKVPLDAKNLISRMLCKNPHSRIDMKGILSHEWLHDVSDCHHYKSKFRPSHIVSAIRAYRHKHES